MKDYAKQPQPVSRTIDSNPKAANQASITEILQRYKKSIIQPVGLEDEDELLQGKFLGNPIQQASIEDDEPLQPKSENKTGLPDDLKAGIENMSGYSMDDVKVHYNSDKPAQLNALAYAQGTDIHVGPGQEKHLPHEAWHVIQQKQGRVQPTMQLQGVNVNDNEGLEKEADMLGVNLSTIGSTKTTIKKTDKLFGTIQRKSALQTDHLKSNRITSISQKKSTNPIASGCKNSVIQAKWIVDGDDKLKWDQIIDGVQWYFNKTTQLMHYEIIDERLISMSSKEKTISYAKKEKPREFWLENSAADFDILAKLSGEVVDTIEDAKLGVINTSSLKLKKMNSQFKYFYEYKGKLLSLPKTNDTSSVLREVAALNYIRNSGILTVDHEIIEVIHNGNKCMGILMSEVTGTFIDIFKEERFKIPNLIPYIIRGWIVDIPEFVKKDPKTGLVTNAIVKQKGASEIQITILENMIYDLTNILEKSKDIVINDLQMIVTIEGRVVVIDPQWAGPFTLTIPGEREHIKLAYQYLSQLVQELKEIQNGS